MNREYTNELNELIRWLTNLNQSLSVNAPICLSQQDINRIYYLVGKISDGIADEYPFYSTELPRILSFLFVRSMYGSITINPTAFGEVFIIVQHIGKEPSNLTWWNELHPRIVTVSRGLFADGYYAAAAESAMKEVETCLRGKFSELKPNAGAPAKIGDVIGALFSDNGVFRFCDTTTISGKDYRRGIQKLFEGAMAAYRNPSAHANLCVSRRAAMEQIVLASQLIFALNPEQ